MKYVVYIYLRSIEEHCEDEQERLLDDLLKVIRRSRKLKNLALSFYLEEDFSFISWFNMDLITIFLIRFARTIHLSLEKFSFGVFVDTENYFHGDDLIPAPTVNKYLFSYLSKCSNLRVLELDFDDASLPGVSDPSEVFKAERFKFPKMEELNIKLRESAPKIAIFKKTIEKFTKNLPMLKHLTLAFGQNEENDDDYLYKHQEFCQKISAKKNIKVEIDSNPGGWDY